MEFQETETVELKKSTSELKEAVISIVAMLNKHQRGEVIFGIRSDGIAGVIGKSLSAVERACSKLVKSGRLRFVGPKKGGCWEVVKA